MSFWRRRERAEAAVRRAVQRLDEALMSGPSGAPGLAEAYGEAVRTAIDVDPELCLSLVRRVEPRIPREQYAAAFSGADAGWLRRCAADDENTAALTVAFEVATRLGLTEISRTARDALVGRLAASRDAAELTGQLTHWLALGMADRAVLSHVLAAQVQRAPLTDQAPVWTAFLRRLPEELQPDLFDVHELLDRAGPAIRLADTPDRVRRALALCRSSTDLSVLAAGVALARRGGDQSALRAVAARAGEVALASGRAEQARDFYTEAGDPAGRSACLEHLGRPFEALEGCPVHRLAALTGECLRRVDAVVDGGDLAQAVRLCRQVLAALAPHTAEEGAQDNDSQDNGARDNGARDNGAQDNDSGRSAIVERQREASAAMRAVLEVARRRFGARLEAGEDAGSVLAEWDRFEEAAGELAAAAELAERGGDVYRAHRLYYQAGRFGEAERVLRVDGSQAGLSARAEARAAGGDRRGAAQLWESAGNWDAAVDLYLEAGDDGAALDCLLRHRRTAALTDPRLATLQRPGNADLLAGLCLQVLDGRSGASSGAQPPASEPRVQVTGALRDAAAALLRSLVAAPELSAAQRTVADDVLAELDGPRRAAFEARAQALVARARADVDQRFARIWGFDLGTTTCAAAIYDTRERRAVLCPWKDQPSFSSTLSLDAQGSELVGLSASEALAGWIVGQVSGSKRRMGRRTVYRIRERSYRPEEIAARLIRHGRTLVESYLATQLRERLADIVRDELGDVPSAWLDWAERHHDLSLDRPRALLTVPAYFMNNAKQATRDACEVAGVDVVRLLHEPTAACVAAAHGRGLKGRVVVVDLGAGTLDLSALEVSDGVYHVQQVLGDNSFGGSDFDTVVTTELLADLSRRGYSLPANGIARRRVAAAAEYLKIVLSGQDHAEHTLVGLVDGEDVTVGLARARLAQLLAQPLERLSELCTQMRRSMPEASEHLVLVGGPMLAPMVRGVVERAFDLRRTPLPDPRTAVARGAALQAAVLDHRLDEVLLLDVTPLPLGVRVVGEDGAPELSVVIEANATIPTEGHRRYTTVRDEQSTVSIEVFNGQLDPEARIATFDLEGIAPASAGEPEIDVRFAIDANCVLEVTARDLGTGRSRSVKVTDSTLLSPGELADLARRQREQTDREQTQRRLVEAVAEAEAIDLVATLSEFSDRLANHRPGRAPLPPQTERDLLAMYRERARVETELTVTRDPLRDLLGAARQVLDSGDAAAAGYVLERLEATLSRLRPTLRDVDHWIAVLISVAVADPDPLQQFRARHAAGHYARALEAVPGPPPNGDPADIERYLHCLAETGDADRYAAALTTHAAVLPGLTRHGQDQSSYPGLLAGTLGTVHAGRSPDTPGTAVLVGDRLVLTTRRALTGGDPARTSAPSADGTTVVLQGAEQRLQRIVLPETDVVDLAVAVLAEPLPRALPLRLGYSGLVRVGDSVQAVLTSSPRSGPPDCEPGTPRLVDGTVERFEAFPELGLNLMLVSLPMPGPAGAPVLNTSGELVGLLTGSHADGIFAITSDTARPLLDRADSDAST